MKGDFQQRTVQVAQKPWGFTASASLCEVNWRTGGSPWTKVVWHVVKVGVVVISDTTYRLISDSSALPGCVLACPRRQVDSCIIISQLGKVAPLQIAFGLFSCVLTKKDVKLDLVNNPGTCWSDTNFVCIIKAIKSNGTDSKLIWTMFQSLVANTVSNMDNWISKPQPFQDSNYKEINLLQVQTWPSHCKPPLTVLRSSQDRELLFSARSLNLQGWSSPTSADVSVTHARILAALLPPPQDDALPRRSPLELLVLVFWCTATIHLSLVPICLHHMASFVLSSHCCSSL